GLAAALGMSLLPHHGQQKRALAATRAALSEPAFAAAWAAGQRMTHEEAIALATGVAAALAAPTPASALTAREREVLCLARAGQTNAQTADALSISPRPVEPPAEHVSQKLGVGTRLDAARVAQDQRLCESVPRPAPSVPLRPTP